MVKEAAASTFTSKEQLSSLRDISQCPRNDADPVATVRNRRKRAHDELVPELRSRKQPRTLKGTPSVIDQFRSEKEQNQALQLELKSKELACMQAARHERRNCISDSTRYQYDRCQALFSKWCAEVGYPDNSVIEGKVLRYFLCLMATEDEPARGIVRIPGRARAKLDMAPVASRGARYKGKDKGKGKGKGKGMASVSVRRNKDLEVGDPDQDGGDSSGDGDINDSTDSRDNSGSSDSGNSSDESEDRHNNLQGGEVRSLSTIDLIASALGELYRQQRTDPDNRVMFNTTERKPREYLADLIESYSRRLANDKRATDTDQGSVEFVEEDPLCTVKMLMEHFWLHNLRGEVSRGTHLITGLRHRLDICWRFFMMCRGEVTRRMRLPDLFAQNVAPIRGQERKFVLGIVLMTRQGKTNKKGKIRYSVAVRNVNVEACPIGALAFYMLEYWSPTSSSSASPPSLSTPHWVNFHFLSKATTPTRKLTYGSQYAAVHKALSTFHIGWKGKATHLGRRQGALYARLCGATIDGIEKHGNWSKSRLITHYLDGIDASVALQMAGFSSGLAESFWLARNTVIPDLELQRKIFPFIEGACSDPTDLEHYDPFWIQIIDNIMMDRSVYHGRRAATKQQRAHVEPKDVPTVLSNETISRRRHLCLLAHLRKVVLQDSAVILSVQNESAKHPIFKRAVFSTPEFRDFQRVMAEALTNTSLGSVSLASVTPAIQQHLAAVTAHMASQNSQQQALGAQMARMSQSFERLQGHNERQTQNVHQVHHRILEGVVEGMKDMDSKLINLTTCLADCLSDVAKRVTTMALAQSQNGSSTAEGKPEAREANLEPGEQDVTMSFVTSANDAASSLAEAHRLLKASEQLQARSHLVVAPISSNDSYDSTSYQAKMRAVVAAIALEKKANRVPDRRMPTVMPPCTLVARPNTLESIWQEWFYGIDGAPSIVEMDDSFGTAWRSDKRLADQGEKPGFASLYLFKKTIVQSVLCFVPDHGQVDMSVVGKALDDFKSMLTNDYNSCSIAAYYKLLPKQKSKRYGNQQEKENGKGKAKEK